MLEETPIINMFTIGVVGYYTNGTTTLKVKFSVVDQLIVVGSPLNPVVRFWYFLFLRYNIVSRKKNNNKNKNKNKDL